MLIQSARTGQFVVNSGIDNTAVITGDSPTHLEFLPPLPAAPGQVLASISSPVNNLFIRPGPGTFGDVMWGDQHFNWLIRLNADNTGTITNPLNGSLFSQNLRVAPHIPLVSGYAVPLEDLVFNFAS